MFDPSVQGPILTPADAPEPFRTPVPLPSTSAVPSFRSTSTLTPLVCDERAIGRLLETLIDRAGLSIEEVARRMGVASSNTVRQYLAGRRSKPSLLWFIKLATLCGARVTVEFPR